MAAQFIVGAIAVCVGILAIVLSPQIPRLIHTGLRIFYGEPVADDAVRTRHLRTHVIVVGCALMVFGSLMVLSSASIL